MAVSDDAPKAAADAAAELRFLRAAVEKAANEAERRQSYEQAHAGFRKIRASMEAGAKASKAAQAAPRIKRGALIFKHLHRWPAIERDLKDASTNGLREAAKSHGIGWWNEAAALSWAQERGKLSDGGGALATKELANLPRKIHKAR